MDVFHLFFVLCFVPSILSQDCDTSSDVTQCSEGQICRNDICETAIPCVSRSDCVGTPGFACVADYCQPEYCTATGQCVNGQVCSQDASSRVCVYPEVLIAQEGSEVTLQFTEPGSGGAYEEIVWYKGATGGSNYRIVFVHPSANGGQPLYYNDYCSGSSPCDTSTKGELNVDTGEFTIYSVELTDDDYYYYNFYIDGGSPDTGHKYEINLIVSELPPECDSSQDSIQCAEGEICSQGVCLEARSCTSGADCSGTPGTDCVADYCQSPTCAATGQCVHGQVCSQNNQSRTCVYPVVVTAQEGSEVTLQFTEPGSGGPYEEITWYKGATGSSSYRIVFVHPFATGGQPLYYNDYCSGSSPCNASTKGELNMDTGEFTIHSVELTDEDYYYYDFYIGGGSPGTGHKYEINLTVSEILPECDSSDDSTQCAEGEICSQSVCIDATPCNIDNDCSGISGTSCVADYCQTDVCNSTGQCVHGQICSHDVNRRCVYPVTLDVVPGSEFALTFSEPGVDGIYEEITWYKGTRDETIALFHPDLTGDDVLYFGEFCSDDDSCDTSEKGELNIQSGDLTIYQTNQSDEGYYYYRFQAPSSGIFDTGDKYEIQLDLCENVVEVCGPLDHLFDDMFLPKVDPKWSMLKTVSAFEDAIGRSSSFKSHTSKNGLKFVMGLTNKMKEWIQNSDHSSRTKVN